MNDTDPDSTERPMHSDDDLRIKALFEQARTTMPDEAFIRRVMSSIQRQERRTRLLQLAWVISVLPFAWVFLPDLAALVATLNGWVESSSGSATALLSALGRSPLTWIFIVPLVTGYLYQNRRRLL
jgi:hypothetical protein